MYHNITFIPAETILKPNMEYHMDSGMRQFEEPLSKKYKLIKCKEPNECNNLIIFGCYSNKIYTILINRVISIKHLTTYLIWGGSDINGQGKLKRHLDILKNKKIKHLTISKCLHNRVTKYNIPATLINFNLVDTDLFKPVTTTIVSKTIYIYSGHPKLNGRNSNNYGKEIYEAIMKELSQFDYILSHKQHVPYNKMPDIYAKCFIVLRLTHLDGNANTAQECDAMNIPIVHNQSDNGLKWKTKDDVITHILNHCYS